MKRRLISVLLVLTILAASLSACKNKNTEEKANSVKLDPKNPVTISIWNYYNGMQLETFDKMIAEFNSTVGLEKGIVVEEHSLGGIDALADAVSASANKEVGASPMPECFAAYADNAYSINKMGLVADISEYMTTEEISKYMDSYIAEGDLGENGVLKLFPAAKSTETFLLNETDWKAFATETGAKKDDLTTWEGLVKVAQLYYEWTDAKTPDVEGDGKAFFGRDAFANYVLIGSMQLGTEMFSVKDGQSVIQIDDKVMRKLWDCYYVPYVNGWFGAYGKYRSDDIKTGQIIALVGSTSGALYFPSKVTYDDGTSYDIECGVYTIPNFEGTKPYAVQQGAGFVVAKSTKEKEYATTVFLKWFTQANNNINFSVNSGYLPVTKEANDINKVNEVMKNEDVNDLLKEVIEVGIKTTTTYTLYTNKAFENGNKARKVAENSMPDAAKAAAQKRDELISQGMSRKEAIASLTSDAAFDEWLAQFKQSMNEAVAD